jgi:hypothetical protein
MSAELFTVTFESPLTRLQLEELASATGMRIGDVDNPYKDTPGKGRSAGSVSLFLGREQQEGAWHIRAVGRALDLTDADMSAVADTLRRLEERLPKIATHVIMVSRGPYLAQWEMHHRVAASGTAARHE